ncbi:MAG TPA: hypothetical protein VN843_34445 [Anaerolineales bacterium]|nr:hypothetical protein [Anaerolineales bacterium]
MTEVLFYLIIAESSFFISCLIFVKWLNMPTIKKLDELKMLQLKLDATRVTFNLAMDTLDEANAEIHRLKSGIQELLDDSHDEVIPWRLRLEELIK